MNLNTHILRFLFIEGVKLFHSLNAFAEYNNSTALLEMSHANQFTFTR